MASWPRSLNGKPQGIRLWPPKLRPRVVVPEKNGMPAQPTKWVFLRATAVRDAAVVDAAVMDAAVVDAAEMMLLRWMLL